MYLGIKANINSYINNQIFCCCLTIKMHLLPEFQTAEQRLPSSLVPQQYTVKKRFTSKRITPVITLTVLVACIDRKEASVSCFRIS